jgi:hypothetical protein
MTTKERSAIELFMCVIPLSLYFLRITLRANRNIRVITELFVTKDLLLKPYIHSFQTSQ